MGKLIKVILNEKLEGKNKFIGILKGLENELVILEIDNNRIDIPLSQISKARLEVNWGKEFNRK